MGILMMLCDHFQVLAKIWSLEVKCEVTLVKIRDRGCPSKDSRGSKPPFFTLSFCVVHHSHGIECGDPTLSSPPPLTKSGVPGLSMGNHRPKTPFAWRREGKPSHPPPMGSQVDQNKTIPTPQRIEMLVKMRPRHHTTFGLARLATPPPHRWPTMRIAGTHLGRWVCSANQGPIIKNAARHMTPGRFHDPPTTATTPSHTCA